MTMAAAPATTPPNTIGNLFATAPANVAMGAGVKVVLPPAATVNTPDEVVVTVVAAATPAAVDVTVTVTSVELGSAVLDAELDSPAKLADEAAALA